MSVSGLAHPRNGDWERQSKTQHNTSQVSGGIVLHLVYRPEDFHSTRTTLKRVNSECHRESHLGVFLIFLLFVEKRNLYSVHWMDLFGTWDFPLLTVNISVVNSLN